MNVTKLKQTIHIRHFFDVVQKHDINLDKNPTHFGQK